MKTFALILTLLTLSAVSAPNNDPYYKETKLYSREEVFNEPVYPPSSPIKYYAELDINGDKIADLLFSESISLSGTGGCYYHVYLGTKEGKFQKVTITSLQRTQTTKDGKWIEEIKEEEASVFVASLLAIEKYNRYGIGHRIWIYSRCSGSSGTISYLYFDDKGKLHASGGLMIFGSPDDSLLGDELMKSIFFSERKIEPKQIKAPVFKPNSEDEKRK